MSAVLYNLSVTQNNSNGTDPITGAIASEKVEDQARQVLTNLKNILEASDLGLNNVVKTTIFLESLDNFKIINQVYDHSLAFISRLDRTYKWHGCH